MMPYAGWVSGLNWLKTGTWRGLSHGPAWNPMVKTGLTLLIILVRFLPEGPIGVLSPGHPVLEHGLDTCLHPELRIVWESEPSGAHRRVECVHLDYVLKTKRSEIKDHLHDVPGQVVEVAIRVGQVPVPWQPLPRLS